jgi:hypothetical protein
VRERERECLKTITMAGSSNDNVKVRNGEKQIGTEKGK